LSRATELKFFEGKSPIFWNILQNKCIYLTVSTNLPKKQSLVDQSCLQLTRFNNSNEILTLKLTVNTNKILDI